MAQSLRSRVRPSFSIPTKMVWNESDGSFWKADTFNLYSKFEQIDDYKRGPGPCLHRKLWSPGSGFQYKNLGLFAGQRHPATGIADGPGMFFSPSAMDAAVSAALSNVTVPTLNRNKLEFADNNFEILNLAFEGKESLSILTPKFWKEVSYGSVNWGVLPLVSEIQGIMEAIRDAANRMHLWEQPYEDQRSHQINTNLVGLAHPLYGAFHDVHLRGEAIVRLSGRAWIPEGSGYLAFLDSIGFHPDLLTVWNLTPLSFLVDYVLPIDDFLGSLIDRGWIKSIVFQGSSSLDFQGIITGGVRSCCTTQYLNGAGIHTGATFVTRYSRANHFMAIHDDWDDITLPTPKLPSLRQLFNVGYVFQSRR